MAALACTADPLQPAVDAGARSHDNPDGWILGPDCIKCTRVAVGNPRWQPARVVLISGNVGAAGEYATHLLQSVLRPPHEGVGQVNAFVSGERHAPPYDDEIYALLDARGIAPAQTFGDVQFTAPQGLVAVMTLVPTDDAPRGRTVDFDEGPVITRDTFPVVLDRTLFRNGTVVARPSQTTIPVLGDQDQSHVFLGSATSSTLAGGPSGMLPDGSYEYRLQLSDARFEGWQVAIPFTVGEGTGTPSTPGADVKLAPDVTGFLDGTNAAGVRGSWWAAGDAYGVDGSFGGGSCPLAGFSPATCSMITAPTPGQPWMPSVDGRMCTAGIAAQVVPDSSGAPAWSSIWGTLVGFNLAEMTDLSGGPPIVGPYDAVAHGFVGFAFDIDLPPAGGHIRVNVATPATNNNAAYWRGASVDVSPVSLPGHYEVRWPEVGGPMYLGPSAPPFNPTQISAISWQVVSNMVGPVPYSFCIANVTLLTK